MKAGIYYGPGDVRVESVKDPVIQQADDAIVKVTHACICGSDLWYWRGLSDREAPGPIGHEFMGRVEAIGPEVTNVQVGDFVIAPFYPSDGTCVLCQVGMSSACPHRQSWGRDGNSGGQGEKVRVPMANGTLFTVDDNKLTDALMPALLPLTDVLCTGHHAAVSASVGPNVTVLVIGDGAVGLCAVAASRRLGAARIILASPHQERAELGKKFGADNIISSRGEAAVKEALDLTDGLGADAVLECVGTDEAWRTSFAAVRPGGTIGWVGVPHAADLKLSEMFAKNINVRGGVAPAANYIPELLPDVLAGKLNVSDIFTMKIVLDELADGYKAMDKREAIKVLIRVS